MKKGIITFMAMILCVSLLAGCSKSVPVEDSVDALYNVFLLGDYEKAIEFGMLTSEEVEELNDKMVNTTKNTFKSMLKSSGLSVVSDEKLDDLSKEYMNIFKKLSYEISTESSDKETSKVKFKTTYVKLEDALLKAAEDTMKEVQNRKISDNKKISELLIDNLIKEMKSLEVSTDKKEITLDFELKKFESAGKTKKLWVPKNAFEFGSKIGQISTGQ